MIHPLNFRPGAFRPVDVNVWPFMIRPAGVSRPSTLYDLPPREVTVSGVCTPETAAATTACVLMSTGRGNIN